MVGTSGSTGFRFDEKFRLTLEVLTEKQQAMRNLLAALFLTATIQLPAQELLYSISEGLEEQTIEEIHLLDNESYLIAKTKQDQIASLKIFDLEHGRSIELPEALNFPNVHEIACHPTQPIIAISSSSKIEKTKIINIDQMKVVNALPIVESGNIAFSSNGDFFCMIEGKNIRLLNWENGTELKKLDLTSGGWVPYELKISPDGRLIAFLAARFDEVQQTRLQKLFLWDMSTGRLSEPFKTEKNHRINEMGFTSFSGQLYILEAYETPTSDYTNHQLVYWKSSNYKNALTKELGQLTAFALSPDGTYLASLEHTYSSLIIHNLKTDESKDYSSPSPSDYTNLQFSKDGSQVLLMGKRLTAFSMGQHFFRTLYESPDFDDIQHAIFALNSQSIVFGNNNYQKPSLTRIAHEIDLEALPEPSTIEEEEPAFVQMEDTEEQPHKITSNITKIPNAADGSCTPFKSYKINNYEVTNQIVHHAGNEEQKTPFGLQCVGFSQDEQLMVSYIPSNEQANFFTSQLLLWNVKTRCPIQEFENQKIEEETYLLLTQPAYNLEVDQINDQIYVYTEEHRFQFDIQSGKLETAIELKTETDLGSKAISQDGNQIALIDFEKDRIRITGLSPIPFAEVSLQSLPSKITWCLNDQILAILLYDDVSFKQELAFYSIPNQKLIDKIELLNTKEVSKLIWLPTTGKLVTVERMGEVKFWDIQPLQDKLNVSEPALATNDAVSPVEDQNFAQPEPLEETINPTFEEEPNSVATLPKDETPETPPTLVTAPESVLETPETEPETTQEPLQPVVYEEEEVNYEPISPALAENDLSPFDENVPEGQTLEDELLEENNINPGELTANELKPAPPALQDLNTMLLNKEFFRAERAAFELLYQDASDYDARVYLTLAYLFQGKYGKAKLTWYKHKDTTLATGEAFTVNLISNLDHLLDNNVSHRDVRKFKSLIQN